MKKEELVAARLPEQLVAALRKIEEVEQADRSTVVRKLLYRAVTEWKQEQAAKRYGEGKLTLERAAQEADVSVREMMEYVRERKITGQYDVKDLEADMARFYRKVALGKRKIGQASAAPRRRSAERHEALSPAERWPADTAAGGGTRNRSDRRR